MVYTVPTIVKLMSGIVSSQLAFADDAAYTTFLSGTLIPRAEGVIDQFCGHNFNNNNGTFTCDGTGKDVVIVEPEYCPLISVSSVTVDGGSSVATECKVYDQFVIYDGGIFTKDYQNVEIIANYGYTAVPSDVALVCEQICANFLREVVRSKLVPDIIVPIMETDMFRGLGALLILPRIFTSELKDKLKKYVFSEVKVG